MNYKENESYYLEKNPNWHVEDSPWKAKQVQTMLQRNQFVCKKIAEVGCGAGEILNQLHQNLPDKTIQFSGCEISPDAMKLARTREKERLAFFEQDLLEVDTFFDLILVMDVIEHVPDYIGFAKKLKTKGAYKIFHIPLDMSMLSILTNYPISARKSVGHLHYFSKDTALATLADAGHEIVDHFFTKSAFEVNNKNLGFAGNVIQLMRKVVFKLNPNLAVKMFGGCSLLVLTK